MGTVSGFIRTKRYRKLENGSYRLQSEWSSSDTTEMPDGTTLTDKMASLDNKVDTLDDKLSDLDNHTHTASDVKSGTFGGDVKVPTSTAYTTNQVRNIVFTDLDPGADATTSHANGSIICVYE